jgi:hypothetical protein
MLATMPLGPDGGRGSRTRNTNMITTPVIPSATLRTRRYRQLHRRVDYIPAHDVMAIIEHHRLKGPERCIAGVIDILIRVGHRSVTGNPGAR